MKIAKIEALELELRIELKEVKSQLELFQVSNNKSFLLSDRGEVIGLHLYNCNIKDLNFLSDFLKLEHLLLSKNEISEINILSNLICLKTLSLAFNNISEIDSLSRLSGLMSLDLRFNKIENISSLANLPNLNDADLRKNLIKDISPLLDHIKNGISVTTVGYGYRTINIMSNKIDPTVLNIIEKGSEAIIRHFERIDDEGFDYIHEAKLTLVGDGSSGKTSLQVKLLDEFSELPKSEERTRGIQISDWQFKHQGKKKFIAHVWDFGGQDVYYPVHRFFITENSVFVLLASTRQPHHNFDYWIPTIFQFGGESPIIIAQTCFDGNKKSWTDVNHYLTNSSFNIVKTKKNPYYELNLPNQNSGLTEIKNVITNQIENLKYFGKKVPKSWVIIRQAIFEKGKYHACITFENFEDICRSESPDNKLTLIDIEDIADFFHSLGIVIWYQNVEELRGWIILNPEWAMNAVYKIIDDMEIQSKMGSISAVDFKRIWSDKIYQHKHSILKKMLEIFKIAFPRRNKPGEYIMPARLDSISESLIWEGGRGILSIEYHFSFMPKGLVNQISADLSRLIMSDSNIWNDAVIFEDEEKISQAQLLENFYEKKIYLKAKGKEARGLIKVIMNSLSNVLDGYKGVKPNIMIPCGCNICKTSKTPTLFEYEKLLGWLTKKNTIRCNESDTDIIINELLFQAGLSDISKEEKVSRMESVPLKAFISYSKFDGEECKLKDGTNYLEAFKETMAPLIKYNNMIQTWDDTSLIPGEEWDNKIKEELRSADIVFLLVSNSFLDTNYILNTELKVAFEREEKGDCIVIPILIKNSGWEDITWISKNNAIPRKGKTISSWKEYYSSVDAAWYDVYSETKKAITNYMGRKRTI